MKPNAMAIPSGLLRIATSLALFFAITWQISDRLINEVFRPGEYFAYFTIQTSLIAAVTLMVAGIHRLRGRAETLLLSRVRISVVSYAVVVAVVYNALLRGLPLAPTDPDYNYDWPTVPNEILHVWVPIVILLDFILTTNLVKLRGIYWVLLFPLAWLLFSILRGLATDWWAYWFLNPNDKGGLTQMIEYIFGICAFLIVAALISLGLNRALGKVRK